MSEPRRITSEDLALFAMQLLSKEEAAEVAAYVAQSSDATYAGALALGITGSGARP